MPTVLDLDDPASRDPLVAGAKAARLALARAVGLPVLPGVVVPVAVARDAMREARTLLQGERADGGRHAAQLGLDPARLALAVLIQPEIDPVVFGGSASAHLVHVARSLGVPALVGCRDLEARLALGATA